MIDTVRQLWAEPGVPNPPRRVWRDWVLAGAFVIAAALEARLRNDLGWPVFAFVSGVVIAGATLWRRTHPLVAVAVAFGAHMLSDMTPHFGAGLSSMLDSSVVLAVMPYAVGRWASGRVGVYAIAIMFLSIAPHSGPNAVHTLANAIGAVIFFVMPAVIGIAVRYRAAARVRETDQAKMREREQLARELHDTVAHHVSAIIIQAQAGSTVAANNPQAAVAALAVIEAEASRTLAEMRFMVSALRQGEAPALNPQRGIADICHLAHSRTEAPMVDVKVDDALGEVQPAVNAAIYRLAQESITNAIRHARHATRVDVRVAADADCVRLTVRDDGDPTTFNPQAAGGYGLIGMRERAKLLGGTLEAGPVATGRGWTITAVLPRHGATA
ncbi:MAG: sensor histidine kinase [Ilumatobacteraceae bacterium]